MSSTRKQQAGSHAHMGHGQPVLDQLRAIQKSIDELKASILVSQTSKVRDGDSELGWRCRGLRFAPSAVRTSAPPRRAA